MKIVILVTLFLASFSISFFISYEPFQANLGERQTKNFAHQLPAPKKPLKTQEQNSSSDTLNELSLEELALLLKGSSAIYDPWLFARVSDKIAGYSFTHLQNALERLRDSQIAGKYQLKRIIILHMAEQSGVDTLDYLLSVPANETFSREIGLVFNNAGSKNAGEIAEWVLSKDYFAVIEANSFAVSQVFAKVAQQSSDTVLAYLPRAHIHLKQHIISGLMANFKQYQQYQNLLDYVTNNEHKIFRLMIVNSMAVNYPDLTASWLANSVEQDHPDSVYSIIFREKVKEDFTEAANWYYRHTVGDKAEAINFAFGIASRKKNHNTQTLLNWAQSLPTEHRDFAIANLLSWQVGEDNDFVMQHYDKVDNKERRHWISLKLFNTLRRENPEGFKEFVANSEFSEEWHEKDALYQASEQ